MKEMAVGQLVDDTTEALQDWQLRIGVQYRYLSEFRLCRQSLWCRDNGSPENFRPIC